MEINGTLLFNIKGMQWNLLIFKSNLPNTACNYNPLKINVPVHKLK